MRKYKMVRFTFSLILIAIIISSFGFLGAHEKDPAETVTEFFIASKTGDTKAMKRLISGPFYDSIRVLLEKNKKYPQFLREHYKGHIIQVVESTIGNTDIVKQGHPKLYRKYYRGSELRENNNETSNKVAVAVVVVRHILPDKNSIYMKLLLQKNKNGVWIIVDEVLGTD